MSFWKPFKKNKNRTRSSKRTRTLAMEPLEQRRLMSVNLQVHSFSGADYLFITGDDWNDTVSFYETASSNLSSVVDAGLANLRRRAPPNALGSLPFPASVVTDAGSIQSFGCSGRDLVAHVSNPRS